VLESRPLKKYIKNKEKTSAKYIALPASLLSGLKKHKKTCFLYNYDFQWRYNITAEIPTVLLNDT